MIFSLINRIILLITVFVKCGAIRGVSRSLAGLHSMITKISGIETERLKKMETFRNDGTDYELMALQLREMIGQDPDPVPVLSNASAILMDSMEGLNWAGFYLMRGDRLVLGPFQGHPACIHIAVGKGVCGTAAELRRTVVVEDVHQFPGHIACDSASRSEIVVPILRGEKVIGVLDLDSPRKGRFSPRDKEGLERFVKVLEKDTDWSGL